MVELPFGQRTTSTDDCLEHLGKILSFQFDNLAAPTVCLSKNLPERRCTTTIYFVSLPSFLDCSGVLFVLRLRYSLHQF